jgi:hypothetical protein
MPMTLEAIQHWLGKKIALHILGCWVGAVLGLLAGLFVLFLTFWLAYVAVFLGEYSVSALRQLFFNHTFHLRHTWRMAICGLFLAALFVEWIRRSPWELGNYGKVNASPGSQALVIQGGVLGACGMLLANPQASAAMITEIIYTGPRLVLGAGSLVREAYRSRSFNLQPCAGVLQLLASRGAAVTYEEFATTWPDVDLLKLKNELARIPGVIFLEKGLTLTDDLRQELTDSVPGN